MQNEMNQIDRMPKKNPLSFQIDLSKFEKATDEEKKQQDVMSESASFFKDGMRKLMKNPLAVGSIIVLVAIVLMIVIVPRVVPYGYSDIVTINGVRDTAAQNMAPLQWSKRSRPISMRAAACSRILWEPTKWDVTILSASSTARRSH